MKQLATILISLSALSAFAQNEPKPSGTSAVMELANGKKARAMLQKLEGGMLTIQLGSKSMTVPVDKLNSLGFSMSRDEFDMFREQGSISEEQILEIMAREGLEKAEKLAVIFQTVLDNGAEAYNAGDLDEVIRLLGPIMLERGQFMSIDNNLQDSYVMLMETYRRQADFTNMRKCAVVLQESSNSALADKARASLAQAALAGDDVKTAETLMAEVESEAAKLYLQACIQKSQGDAKAAIQTVTEIIADHANDVEWMAPTEFLSALLYLDLAKTNSAAVTARQVKNIYAGTSIAADAAKLQAQLQPEEAAKE